MKKNIKLSVVTTVLGTTILVTTLTSPISLSANSHKVLNNISLNTNTNNVQTVNSVNDIKYSFLGQSEAAFAIVKDSINGDLLYGWGDNLGGKLGIGHIDRVQLLPKLCFFIDLPPRATINSVHSGGNFTAVLVNGNQLYLAGSNGRGELGNEITTTEITVFMRNESISGLGTIDKISTGNAHSMVVINNEIYTWGYNHKGQIGNNKPGNDVKKPFKVEKLPIGKIKNIWATVESCYALIDNELWAWGNTFVNGVVSVPGKINLPAGNITKFSSSDFSYIVVLDDVHMYGWGKNLKGELGLGNTTPQTTPVLIPFITLDANNVIDTILPFESGFGIVIATKENDMISKKWLYMAGINNYGQLGDGTNTDSSSFKLVDSYDSTSEFQSFKFGIVTTTNGVTHAWGRNSYGTFGIGTNQGNNTLPVLIDAFGTSIIGESKANNSNITASEALNTFWDGTNFNQINFEKYINLNLPSSSTTFSVAQGIDPIADDANQTIALSLIASEGHHAYPNGQKTTANTPINFTITKFKDPNAVVADEFPWWWVLIGMNGAAIIVILAILIFKKQKTKKTTI